MGIGEGLLGVGVFGCLSERCLVSAMGGLWGGGLGAGEDEVGDIKKERDGGRVSSVSL